MAESRKSKKEALAAQYRRVFGTKDGQAVLDDLMLQFHMLNGHGGSELCEGERNAVLYIIDKISTSPREFREKYKTAKDDAFEQYLANHDPLEE